MKKEQSALSHRRYLGLWIFAVIIAILLAGSTIRLETVKNSYRKDIQRMQKTYLPLSQKEAAMEETKQRRVEYFRNRFFADYPSRFSYGAADFMRRLSLIDARGVELGKLEIIPRGQDLSFNLNVSVTAANDSHAQGIFSRFYQALKNFEDILEINFSTASAGSPAPASAVRDKAKRPYNITGVIELE